MPLKVLLADDSMTAQNMGKKMLTDAGCQVVAVSNGAQAMKKIVAEKPDVVVLDVFMPGYSGLEVCELMRKRAETARTPVILCVGKLEPFNAQDGNRVKADGVIVKPFEASDLVTMVKKLAHKAAPVPVAVPDAGGEAMPFGEYKGVLWRPSSEEQAAEPELQPQRNVEVPHEMGAAPAMGLEEITQEPESAGTISPLPEFEIEYERERQQEPEPVSAGMTAAEGLSGVFELRPATPVSEPAPQVAAPWPTQPAAGEIPEASPDAPRTMFSPEAQPGAREPALASTSMEAVAFDDLRAAELPPRVWDLTPVEEVSGIESPKVWDLPMSRSEPVAAAVAAAVDDKELDETFASLQTVAPAPVWVAEEVPLGPGEAESSLEREMLQASVTTSGGSMADFHAPAIAQPEWSPSEAESMTVDGGSPEPEPMPAAAGTVALSEGGTDPAADPELIARVIDRVIQRLKPELIAEISRELRAELDKH